MANLIIANDIVIELTEDQMNTILKVAQGLTSSKVSTITTPVKESAPAPVAKTYDHVTEGFTNFAFTQKDNTITIAHKDGSFLYEKAVRQALNARLSKAGAKYIKESHAWEFTKSGKRDIKGAKDFIANNSGEVTADEINAIRDNWTKKSAKRAGK